MGRALRRLPGVVAARLLVRLLRAVPTTAPTDNEVPDVDVHVCRVTGVIVRAQGLDEIAFGSADGQVDDVDLVTPLRAQ